MFSSILFVFSIEDDLLHISTYCIPDKVSLEGTYAAELSFVIVTLWLIIGFIESLIVPRVFGFALKYWRFFNTRKKSAR